MCSHHIVNLFICVLYIGFPRYDLWGLVHVSSCFPDRYVLIRLTGITQRNSVRCWISTAAFECVIPTLKLSSVCRHSRIGRLIREAVRLCCRPESLGCHCKNVNGRCDTIKSLQLTYRNVTAAESSYLYWQMEPSFL